MTPEREKEIRRELQPEHTEVIDCLIEIDALRALCKRAGERIEDLCEDNGSHEKECERCGPIIRELKAAGGE